MENFDSVCFNQDVDRGVLEPSSTYVLVCEVVNISMNQTQSNANSLVKRKSLTILSGIELLRRI